MPDVDGVEATRRITATHPASRVVILTASDDPPHQGRAAGRRPRYVPKGDPDQVVRAVQDARTTAA